jgi:hypothetical protein
VNNNEEIRDNISNVDSGGDGDGDDDIVMEMVIK